LCLLFLFSFPFSTRFSSFQLGKSYSYFHSTSGIAARMMS
jgi:hypothetical protein